MQAKRPVMPELDRDRPYPETRPVGRPWNGADRIFRGVHRDRGLEREARLKRARLLGCPSADSAVARTRVEIGVGLRIAHHLDRAPDSHLPAQRLPMEA